MQIYIAYIYTIQNRKYLFCRTSYSSVVDALENPVPPPPARLGASIPSLLLFLPSFGQLGGSLVPFSREYPERSRDESWLPGRWLCLMNFVRRMGFEHFPSMFGNDGGRTWPCWTLFALAAHPGFPPWSWSSSSNKIWIPACSSSSFLSCCADTQSLTGQPQPPRCPQTTADTAS